MQGAPQDVYCFMIKVYCEKDKRVHTEKTCETQCLDNTEQGHHKRQQGHVYL